MKRRRRRFATELRRFGRSTCPPAWGPIEQKEPRSRIERRISTSHAAVTNQKDQSEDTRAINLPNRDDLERVSTSAMMKFPVAGYTSLKVTPLNAS